MISHKQTNETDPELLVNLLREQLDLYRRLKRLSQRQRDLVTQEDPRPLLALLAERQKVVDDLTSLGRRLAPIQSFWRENRATMMNSAQRRDAESLLRETGETLKSVLSSDEEDSQLLAARKVQTANYVQALAAGTQAYRAYSPAATRKSAQYLRTDESA